MPSIKNSCEGCALSEIPKKQTKYTVEDIARQNYEIQIAIHHFAGLESSGLSQNTIISEAARRCIGSINSGQCNLFQRTDEGFEFRS